MDKFADKEEDKLKHFETFNNVDEEEDNKNKGENFTKINQIIPEDKKENCEQINKENICKEMQSILNNSLKKEETKENINLAHHINSIEGENEINENRNSGANANRSISDCDSSGVESIPSRLTV